MNREKMDRELEEEMRFHQEMKERENLRNGLSPEDARDEARRKFGNGTRLRETSREVWGFISVETLVRDIRFGLRTLLKQPVFTLIALVSLSFGIGANTAIFSLLNTATLRPLPIDRPGELVALNSASHFMPTVSYPNYKDFRDRNEVFSGLIGYSYAQLNLSHDGVNERLWGYLVTGNYFDVLGVRPALGRLISTEDDRLAGASPVAVLSYESWQKRFGGGVDVIGKNVIVNNGDYTIIGVAPRGFFGTEVITAPDLYFPMAMGSQIEVGVNWLTDRDVNGVVAQGRLKPGVSVRQAQQAVDAIAAQLREEFPGDNEGLRITLSKPGLMGAETRGAALGFVGALMLVVGLVLLLACVNLANLLLARAAERRREIAVRLALGASRFRLARQLLTESLMLSLGGGALGTLFAFWLVRLANSFKAPVNAPLLIDLRIDYRVLLFTLTVSILAGVLFGLVPAMQATKTDLIPVLKNESAFSGRPRSRLKNSLIVLQVALSLMLLIAGGLTLRGLRRAQNVDLGFEPRGAVEMSFDLRLQGYDASRAREMQRMLLDRARALPGVQAAALADMVPVDLHFMGSRVYVEGQAPQRKAAAPRALTSLVSPGYFQAMGMRLARGRDFTAQDREKATPVAIVNESFARRFWPGEDPIGKRLSMGDADSPKLQVVGVARDGKYNSLDDDPKMFVYRPIFQFSSGSATLIVRAGAAPNTLDQLAKVAAAVREEAQRIDPHLPISTPQALSERLSFAMLPVLLAASVLGSFGLLALLLAAIGIYGVMSYTVSRRTREIGVRMALGARSADVLKLVIGQGMILVAIGVAIGLMASLALTRLMKNLLYGIGAADPAVFALITLLLALVALLAFYLPARRAVRVDPAITLRYE
jgi:predicted permease